MELRGGSTWVDRQPASWPPKLVGDHEYLHLPRPGRLLPDHAHCRLFERVCGVKTISAVPDEQLEVVIEALEEQVG